MRIFGSDRIAPMMERLGMEEGVPIEHKLVTRSIEHAQKQVESRNFEIRKHLLEYDDVMNKQREAVYGLRRKVLEEETIILNTSWSWRKISCDGWSTKAATKKRSARLGFAKA